MNSYVIKENIWNKCWEAYPVIEVNGRLVAGDMMEFTLSVNATPEQFAAWERNIEKTLREPPVAEPVQTTDDWMARNGIPPRRLQASPSPPHPPSGQ